MLFPTSDDNQRHHGMQNLQAALRLGLAVVTEVWSYATSDWIYSVYAADIDGDGDTEVLVGSRDRHVCALTKLGIPKWNKSPDKAWIGTVVAVDEARALDATRVVVGSRNNNVYAFDGTGTQRWQYATGLVVRQVIIADIDLDGKSEVVVASEDRYIHVLSCETGECLWKYPTNAWVRTICVFDADNDGEIEILGGSGDNFIYVLDCHGNLKWRYDAGSKIYTLFVHDVDKDGVNEILVGSDAKDFYALTLTPTGQWQRKWQLPLGNRALSTCVADVNNDGLDEIIVGCEDQHLYILDAHGEILWKHNVGARIFSVFARDIDHDGLIEVLVGSEDSNVHVLHIELIGGELSRILECYQQMGHTLAPEITLSPTESTLLSTLTSNGTQMTPGSTLADLEAARATGDSLQVFSHLLKLKQQKAQMLWCRPVAGYVRAIELGKSADDPHMKIIVGTNEGRVYALDSDGQQRWSYSLSNRVRTIQIADVDDDGEIEVVVGSIDGRVYVLDKNGSALKWHIQHADWVNSIYIAATNPSEILMGSEEKHLIFYDARHGDASTPSAEPIAVPQGIQVVLASDINDDGKQEILAGAIDDYVYVYSREGDLQWAYKTWDRVRALFVTDIDLDQHREILVGSEDRSAHVLDQHGSLKWRYCAPHRVLDVHAIDLDQDGKVEVLLGCGDGCLYVLNADGDLIWRYLVNDRIRVVRVADVNADGIDEIVLGTEDQIYMLQILDQQALQQQIEACWNELLQQHPVHTWLDIFILHEDPTLRAYALQLLTQQPQAQTAYPLILQKLIKDASSDVRRTFAQALPIFYRAYPEATRRFFDTLAADRERDVRLAFVDSLPEIIQSNRDISFAYLDRFTRSVDMWVRRAVIRALHRLVVDFPAQTFPLLLITAQDAEDWIRQETARTLAYYFDNHIDNLVEGSRALSAKGTDVDVYKLISTCATRPVVQDMFRVVMNLSSDLNYKNIREKLHGAVDALQSTKGIRFGYEMWQVYDELAGLVNVRNVEEIANYQYSTDDALVSRGIHFKDTIQIVRQLTTVTNVMNAYRRRAGLGDRLACLLEAHGTLEALYTDAQSKYSDTARERQHLADRAIFVLLLGQWRSIVAAELKRLSGKAEMRLEIQTKALQWEKQVVVLLTIHNTGTSPADAVCVSLLPDSEFIIIGRHEQTLEYVPSREFLQIEFTIQPLCAKPRLTFEVHYNDASAKNEHFSFADRLELLREDRQYRPINNPYYIGKPISKPNNKRDMFYGREKDKEELKSDLINQAINVTVVLYGQRRSGKTSLLNQFVFTNLLEPHIPVYIDMQNESLQITIGKLLRNMAYYIKREIDRRHIPFERVIPSLKEFEDDPTFIFNCFLNDVEFLLQERMLILFIDEFEILEQKVKDHALPLEIFEYLRSLMQHRPQLRFLFSGTHTIEQLTRDYWSVFFNIASHHKLSPLGGDAAKRLIVKPVEGFLEYDPYAIEKIRQLSADQPYLIQLICHTLVDHCNSEHKNYVTINDVNAILDRVMETGTVHFQWIWDQTDQQERIVLSILARLGGEDRRLLSLADIEGVYKSQGLAYHHKKVLDALSGLVEKDIVKSDANNTRFKILLGLAQRWFRDVKALERVMWEENLFAQ